MVSSKIIASLTARQRDVAELIACGPPVKEIAKRLRLAESTVRYHLRAAADLLGLPRESLASVAYAAHLVDCADCSP